MRELLAANDVEGFEPSGALEERRDAKSTEPVVYPGVLSTQIIARSEAAGDAEAFVLSGQAPGFGRKRPQLS
jgi:hypothetical protein